MSTTVSRASRPDAPPRPRREWWIPASLLALTFVPVAAGAARLVDLSSGRTTENARFFDLPVPVVVHILGATTYCVLGAFQFMPSFRRRRPRWHRWSGRVLVPAGLAAAVSGLVMAVSGRLPAYDNTALMWLRLVFGTLMAVGLVLGLAAIRARDVRTHQRWMARSYAVAQGAGTQALVLGPMVLVRRPARRWPQGRGDGVRVGAEPRRGGVAGAALAGASVEPAGLIGPERELDPVADAELAHEGAEVRLHRAERDVELGGDLVVGQPAGHRDQHLLLALGQR